MVEGVFDTHSNTESFPSALSARALILTERNVFSFIRTLSFRGGTESLGVESKQGDEIESKSIGSNRGIKDRGIKGIPFPVVGCPRDFIIN